MPPRRHRGGRSGTGARMGLDYGATFGSLDIERLRRLAHSTALTGAPPIESYYEQRISPNTTDNKKYMVKERHLTQEERMDTHSPQSDWQEGERGEHCVNACSLDVSDIVSKFKDKQATVQS